MFVRISLIIIMLVSTTQWVVGQNDTIRVKNGLSIVGEVKNFRRNMFTVDVDFSDNNIRIEWDDIESIDTQGSLLITDGDGNRHYGKIESIGSDTIKIITDQYELILEKRSELIFAERIEEGFKHRFFFSIDIGFSMTQANNLRQWTSNSRLGYKANKWILEGRFSGLTSAQDETETIYRWDRNLSFSYIFPGNWLINPEVNFFSSTEQKIDLRIVPRLGIGKILERTNHVVWSCTGGINLNFEDYAGEAEDRNSVEAFLGTELNLYDIEDFDFFGEFVTYPSLTESGRWRYDLSLDLKYDLPLGFFLTTGFTYNFDNMPTEEASGRDYLLNAGVGWKW